MLKEKMQPDNGQPHISVTPVKMFMHRLLIKQALNISIDDEDALKSNKNKGGGLVGVKFLHKILFELPTLTLSL